MKCPNCSHEFFEADALSMDEVRRCIEADEDANWYEIRDGDCKYIEDLGPIERVASQGGGEGSGSEMWVVVKIGSRLFKKSGYYASWDGDNWDGPFEEVRPRERMVTFYE